MDLGPKLEGLVFFIEVVVILSRTSEFFLPRNKSEVILLLAYKEFDKTLSVLTEFLGI